MTTGMKPVLRDLSCKPAFRWALVLFWMSVIYAFSDQPNSSEITEQVLGSLNVLIRKCAHMFEYGILFLLTRWASISIRRPSVPANFFAFFICLLYAASDEWHQSFVPNRSAQLQDVGVDMVGVLIAALCSRYFLVLKSFCSRTRS